jgi:hypothetical protein
MKSKLIFILCMLCSVALHAQDCPECESISFIPTSGCTNEPVNFTNTSTGCVSGTMLNWEFGDGTSHITQNPVHTYAAAGTYTITVSVVPTLLRGCSTDTGPHYVGTGTITITDCAVPCSDCIGSFAPVPGSKYVLSAWVKENNGQLLNTYQSPQIVLTFSGASQSYAFNAEGPIIDGWQRIEKTFTVPSTATDITVDLQNTSNDPTKEVFFDDIRVHPFDANMKSFVYDPVSLRLVAELDNNNYATFYEYDEEGKLIRVKKETQRGIMTIKESRDNTVKK